MRCIIVHMTRVMVIGNAGGGKSALSRAICAAHDLPCHAIDHMLWRPGWQRVPEDEYRARHDAVLTQDRWLIDGVGSWGSVLARLAHCDTVVFVDLPLRTHLWWATKRQATSLFRGRADGPPGCPMWKVTFRLYRMMWWLHRDLRPMIAAAVAAAEGRVRVIRLTSPRALNAFAAAPV